MPKLTRAADSRSAPTRGLGHSLWLWRHAAGPSSSVFRNLRTSPPTINEQDRADPTKAEEEERTVGEPDQNMSVDLGRLAWLGTVGVCLIAVLILVLQGYYGYAGVTFAVAVAAGINLL